MTAMTKRLASRDRSRPRGVSSRPPRRPHPFEISEDRRLGPHLVTADLDTVKAACLEFDPAAPWETVRERLVPLLPRARPLPVPIDGLVQTIVPPGILTGFGVDLGPAYVMVARDQLARWGIGVETATSTALANVRRLAASCDASAIHRSAIDGVPLTAVQSGQGIASVLILVPDCIERLLGAGPNLLLAPMRDILVALPMSVDREFAAWLAAELEAVDPNHLHLGAFRHERGSITAEPLEDAVARA